MKFLLISKTRTGAPEFEDPVASYQAAKEWMSNRLADGTVECAYASVVGGVTIVNASSHEELWELLRVYPLFRRLEFEVVPLVDFNYVVDQNIHRSQERTEE